MKKILQSAALLIMTASVVWAAVISPHPVYEKCSREWEKVYKKKRDPAADNKNHSLTGDIFFMNHLGIN
jgi:hypothetical protein